MHISSSIHEDKIRAEGLKPTNFSKKDVTDYIDNLVVTEKVLEVIQQLEESSSSSYGLVRSRLSDTKQRLCFMPCQKSPYYQDIINSVKDGGEFYSAIRKAVEEVKGVKIEPLHPDASPIVCIVKFKVEVTAEERRFIISADGSKRTLLPGGVFQDLSLDYPIAAEEIEILTDAEFTNEYYYP